MSRSFLCAARLRGILAVLILAAPAIGRADELPAEARRAALKAVSFYWKQLSTEGGYLWRHSADLTLQEGEEKVGKTTVWVQPPGTPSMGEAYVRLYEATGESLFRDAALAAAEALRKGQMRSGGWDARIEFAPEDRKRFAYRIDPPRRGARNNSTLDDDKSQSAMRFLIRLDRAIDFGDPQVHDTVTYALQRLVRAQYPNGGFPQVWDDSPRDDQDYPVVKARYPESWSRTYRGHNQYWYGYTLNDNLLPDVVKTLLLAAGTYQDERYRQAVVAVGDFLLLAQMPEPQPAWAQQYDFQLQPIWARKFEPPAVTGGESQGAIRVLMQVYELTRDRRYLEPIPRALAYLNASRLPNGRLARFYELHTNRPLYFTRDYQLTYDDSDVPTHYSFTTGGNLRQIERQYRQLAAGELDSANEPEDAPSVDAERIRQICQAMDDRGAWVTQGRLRAQTYQGPIIDMRVAQANLKALADYLESARRSSLRSQPR